MDQPSVIRLHYYTLIILIKYLTRKTKLTQTKQIQTVKQNDTAFTKQLFVEQTYKKLLLKIKKK